MNFIQILNFEVPFHSVQYDESSSTSASETFERKKSDAQVGRVNTFHILPTMRKGPSNFKLCLKDL
jgi:hypothetical protein